MKFPGRRGGGEDILARAPGLPSLQAGKESPSMATKRKGRGSSDGEFGEFVPAVFARSTSEAEEYRELLNDHDIPAIVEVDEEDLPPRVARPSCAPPRTGKAGQPTALVAGDQGDPDPASPVPQTIFCASTRAPNTGRPRCVVLAETERNVPHTG